MAEVKHPHLHITFYMDAAKDHAKSRDEGRPIFTDVEMVQIKFVGDNKRELHAPAHERFMLGDDGDHITYAQAYPDHYAAFKAKNSAALTGTPLTELPFLSQSKRKELEAINIMNAEGLAGLNHSQIKRLGMGGRELVEQAQSWLEGASNSAAVAKANAERDAMAARIAALEARLQGEPIPAKASDDPDGWDVDRLKEYLSERGVSVRANQARDKLIEAVRAFMLEEAA